MSLLTNSAKTRYFLRLQIILLFSVFLLPSALHLQVCPPALQVGTPATGGHCHEQQHAAGTTEILPEVCGDCHQQPASCGRTHDYPGLHQNGREKLRTRTFVPLLESITPLTLKICLWPVNTRRTYSPPYSALAAEQLLALRSTVIRC
ncbi:MAG: hypothetical protein GX564_02835 [Oligosphaeraceae bacterium]|nr:hypothetical protein [Oligosphaeraceae bacterium]